MSDLYLPAEVVCGLQEASCICILEPAHAGPHKCHDYCGGSWGFDADGRFVSVRIPGTRQDL